MSGLWHRLHMILLPEKTKMTTLAPRDSNSHPLSPCHLNLGFLRLYLGVTSGHHDSNLHPTIAAVQLHIAAHTKPLSESRLAPEELAAAFQDAQGTASPTPKVNTRPLLSLTVVL